MARRTAPTFKTRLRHALAAEDIDELLAVVGSRRKTTAGTPPMADISTAVRLIAAHLAERPRVRLRWALSLGEKEDPTSKSLSCGLLPHLWPHHPRSVENLLRRLADDEHWAVREAAGGALGRVLREHLDGFYDRCVTWTQHPSPNVRRAVCIAAMVAGKTRRPEWAEPLLDLLEPLLPDRTPYVRKNLGSFAIGNGMLRCYPEQTLERLRQWAEREDAGTRWNVAMAFSAASGADRWQEGLPILADLAADERRYVWRAVASALRVIGRRHPAEVVPRLQAWLEHSQRSRPAQAALRYVTEQVDG